MRARLIHVTVRRAGTKARREETVEVEAITIGRGTDNVVHAPSLQVALHHAVLHLRPDGLSADTLGAGELRINGRVSSGSRVEPGDVLRVGNRELRILEPAAGEDVAVEIEDVEAAVSELDALRSRTRIGIESGLLTRSRLATLLVLAVFVPFVVPLAARLIAGTPAPGESVRRSLRESAPRLPAAQRTAGDRANLGAAEELPAAEERPTADAAGAAVATEAQPAPEASGNALVRMARGMESAWLSGALAPVHANLAGDCAWCHVAPFAAVRDTECAVCHASIARHVRADLDVAELDSVRCASCHHEHEGEGGPLGMPSDLCTSCHGALATQVAGVALQDAAGFTSGHPEIRPTVVLDAGTASSTRIDFDRLPKPGATAAAGEAPTPAAAADASQKATTTQALLRRSKTPAEHSGLAFPHTKHLAAGIRGPDGTRVTLACADCHAPEPSGALMLPIRFQEQCSHCHPLVFDPAYPGRHAPHAAPAEVKEATFDFYAGLALRGEVQDTSAPPVVRRRPGRDLTPEERIAALAWATEKAAGADTYLLGDRGVCDTCHTLSEREGAVSVEPVLLVPNARAPRWLPLSRFSHAPHAAVECARCHPAATADSAEMVLMPSIAVCQQCHGDAGRAGEVPSNCLLCHDFHHPRHGPMRAQELPVAEGDREAPAAGTIQERG